MLTKLLYTKYNKPKHFTISVKLINLQKVSLKIEIKFFNKSPNHITLNTN